MYDRVITIKLDYSKVPSKSTVPTYGHLSAFIAAKTFGQTRIDTFLNQQRCAAINQHNEEVKKIEKS